MGSAFLWMHQISRAASRASAVAATAFPGDFRASPTTKTCGTNGDTASLKGSLERVPMASTTVSYPRRERMEPSVPLHSTPSS